jgi:hypothetical protein
MKEQLIETEIKRLMEIMSIEVSEGFDEEGNPDFKYYAFDWDDNLMFMPTEIIVLSYGGTEVGMGTADFAEYRSLIGKENFDYKGHTIVSFAENPFRNFGVDGNEQFVKDALVAKTGPSWNDFVECINGGSIFSIITARGHNPETLREGVEAIVKDGKGGLSMESCVDSLKKYKGVIDGDSEEMFQEYLDMCRFHPVSFGAGSAANPEEEKIKALEGFIQHVNKLSEDLKMTMELENDIKNNFVPTIGFSDDDYKNVENVKNYLDDKGEENVNVYYTKTDKTKM